MNRLMILASVVALAAGAVGCGNSPGQANSLVDVGPSAVSDSSQGGGNLTTLAKGGGGGGGKGSAGGGATTGGGGSLAWRMVTDLNGNGSPNWGDTVTWTFSTSASEPHVDLTCSQNGTVVYGATTGFYASYPWPWTQNMTLSSQAWSAGSANCVGVLYVFSGSSKSTLATTSFTANP